MREEMLKSILSDLNGSSADIEASAVISIDGLTIAALLASTMDEDRVGAMAAAILSLGDRTATELARCELEQVMIKGGKWLCPAHSRRARRRLDAHCPQGSQTRACLPGCQAGRTRDRGTVVM